MNTDLLLRVADHIDAHPETFDMSWYATTNDDPNICDTLGCVAGWTVMIERPEVRSRLLIDPEFENEYDFEETAQDLLDLTWDDAMVLFTSNRWWAAQMHRLGFETHEIDPGEYWVGLEDIPAKAAVAVLHDLADGVINLEWDRSLDV